MNIEWLLVGIVGFEPTNNRVKVCCLTAWRYPYTVALTCGVGKGIRTPDNRLRRAMLYPAELQTQFGASDGNRTHAASLEGWNSTIELHSHFFQCL